MIVNYPLNNDKSMSYPDPKISLWRPVFAMLIRDQVRKPLGFLDLGEYHKILGLILDRPQDVAVMSLPHEEVRGRLVVQSSRPERELAGPEKSGREDGLARSVMPSEIPRDPIVVGIQSRF